MDNYIKKALQFEPSEEQYQQILARLCQPQMIRLLHGLIGMETEVGELFDQFKKHIFYGKPLDTINLAEEIGDVDWYRGVTVDALAILNNQDTEVLNNHILEKNIAKLTARYQEKFTSQAALNRDLNREREILEATIEHHECSCFKEDCNCTCD